MSYFKFIVIGGVIALTGCSKGDDQPQQTVAEPSISSNVVQETASEAAVAVMSDADRGRVCRGSAAALNGRSYNTVKVIGTNQEYIRVQWKRPDDGKKWKQDCRFEGDKVIWRGVDAFGPGSGEGRWRTDPRDETITYKLERGVVTITIVLDGEQMTTKTFAS